MPPLVNVNPKAPEADGAPDPLRLLQFGIRGARMVVRHPDDDPEGQIRAYKQALQAAGLVALGVVTEESHGAVYADDPFDVYQLGNESDRKDHGDTKTATELVHFWNLYYDTWFAEGKPLYGRPVIGPGLCTGQTRYWQQVKDAGGLKGAAGFAIHPYAQTPIGAMNLVLNYRAITPSLPVWITECHPDLATLPAFFATLRQTSGVIAVTHFCWHRYAEGNMNFQLGDEGARLIGAFG